MRKIQGLFTCKTCGEENADRNAAFNIAYRALGYISKVGVIVNTPKTFPSVDRNAMSCSPNHIVIKGDTLKPHIKSIMTNDLQRLSIPILFDSEYAFYNQYEMGSELLYLISTEVNQRIVKGC